VEILKRAAAFFVKETWHDGGVISSLADSRRSLEAAAAMVRHACMPSCAGPGVGPGGRGSRDGCVPRRSGADAKAVEETTIADLTAATAR
jgi:hypothetical protein